MFEYIIIMAVTVFIPLIILWIWKWEIIRKHKYVFPFAVIGALIFAPIWDYIAVKEKIWLFTSEKILNIWFLGLPLEEWLLYIFFTLLFSTFTIILWEKWGVKK